MAFPSVQRNNQVQPQASFDLIPAGKYICQIVESEIKSTKAGTGQQLVLTWEVLDGEFKAVGLGPPEHQQPGTSRPGTNPAGLHCLPSATRQASAIAGQRTVAQQANAHPRQHQEERRLWAEQ